MHALHILNVFKSKWMRLVLSQVHDKFMWLDAPIKIIKDVLQIITGYPIGDRPKAHKQTDKKKMFAYMP